MTGLEQRYRRLLHWYPPAWRAANGEVLIGTLLDTAEAEGRTRPTGAEARSMILHGFGERFTVHLALYAAIAAVLTSSAGMLALLGGVAQSDGGWLPIALNVFAMMMATVSALGLLRHAGPLRAEWILPALGLATSAWLCTFLATWAWSIGFDEADAGLARTPFSFAFAPLFFAGWALGGAAMALIIVATTRALPLGARVAVTAIAALVCPPLLGTIGYAAGAGVMIGFALAAISVTALNRMQHARLGSDGAGASGAPLALAPQVRRRTGSLALVSAVLGVVCAAFALAGSTLTTAIDSTRAMQLGLGAGAVACVPLLFAFGVALAARRPRHAGLIWLAVSLAAVGILIHAALTISGATASGNLPWAALLPLAAGVCVLTFALMRASSPLRWLLAAMSGIAALLPLWMILVAAGFLLPPIAAVLAVVNLRRHARTTASRITRTA